MLAWQLGCILIGGALPHVFPSLLPRPSTALSFTGVVQLVNSCSLCSGDQVHCLVIWLLPAKDLGISQHGSSYQSARCY